MSIRLNFEDCLGDFENSNTQHEVFGLTDEEATKILEEYVNIIYESFMQAFENHKNKLDIRALKTLFETRQGLKPNELLWLMLNLRILVASTQRRAEHDYAIKQNKKDEEVKELDTSKLISLKHKKDG